MKKKLLCVLLTTAMAASMLAGCGEKASSDGKVLNIYCWNDEFQRRVADHYPGYEPDENDPNAGKINDVTVKWHITPSADNAYQNGLDNALEKQSSAAADEKIDIFLVEADYALKYVDADVAMPIKDLGISDSDLADQYKYTKDIVTDSKGVLRGVSWQGCPGVLFYNREACKDIWGTDDAAEIQKKVADWKTFTASAAEAAAKGYKMTSTVNDTYRVYSNNVSTPWVVDGKVVIDENIKKWVDDSKAMVDAGYTATHDLWSDDWKKGFFPDGKTVCYFGPAWLVNFSMSADQEGSIGNLGGWGATEGPQGFYWGGTWICAAEGTDNADIVKDIMLKLTTDKEIMKGIVVKDDDFVNNKPAMNEMANDASYSSAILGNTNPLKMYCAGAEKIDLSNLSAYDQGCNEAFQSAMSNYFKGNATYDEALEQFKKAVKEKYPDLTVE